MVENVLIEFTRRYPGLTGVSNKQNEEIIQFLIRNHGKKIRVYASVKFENEFTWEKELYVGICTAKDYVPITTKKEIEKLIKAAETEVGNKYIGHPWQLKSKLRSGLKVKLEYLEVIENGK